MSDLPTSNHWYVNGEQYDSLIDACEDAIFDHTVVLDDDDKVVADYSQTPAVTLWGVPR
jgi:hypothetical protein